MMCITVVAGCPTVSRDMVFQSAPDTAFALVVADGMTINGSESYDFNFQRVDLQASQFLQDRFTVTFSGMGPIEGNEFRKPEGMETTLRFGGRSAPPGAYALVSRVDRASYGPSTSTRVNCFSLGATVFDVRAGAVNLIPGGNVRRPAPTLRPDPEQAADVLRGYPGVTAPIAPTEVLGGVTFATGRSAFGAETCNPSGALTFTPVRGQ
jgi:hypothetical protein